jgi:hypothetical protein
MRRYRHFRWAAVLTLAIAVAPGTASAQEADTLSISGTFRMYSLNGTVGADLAQVYANGYDHTWTLTLHGVSYSHDYGFWESGEVYNTRVHATSFTFEFFGPDAAILNDVVSSQLTQAGLELSNEFWVDSDLWLHSQGFLDLRLEPPDLAPGVSFEVFGYSPEFAADENGYPLVEPKQVRAFSPTIRDDRPGSDGSISSVDDVVNIGSTEPPYLTPWLRIHDGSVLEGDRSTTRLNLIVTLTQFASTPITVNYATADGSASRKSDYTAKSGTLTFQTGQSEATIPLAIKGDRKRESDETLLVRLSNAAGATIVDSVATVTILNDD